LLKDYYKDFVIEKSLSNHEVYAEIWFKNSPEIRFNQNNSSTFDNFQNFNEISNGSSNNQEIVEANTSLLKNSLELCNMLQKCMGYIDEEEKSNSDDVTNFNLTKDMLKIRIKKVFFSKYFVFL
jgi:hypothetical protein